MLVKTEASGTQTYYVYGLGLIGQETGGEYTSYHFDYRGSTKALTDKTGQVTERFQYSPYGLLVSGDATKTPFLFNGMYGVMTDDNGLYYMRARFYSPEMRRFVNQDVLLGNIEEGQTLNRYAYVTGRPVNYVDPFGLFVYVDATMEVFLKNLLASSETARKYFKTLHESENLHYFHYRKGLTPRSVFGHLLFDPEYLQNFALFDEQNNLFCILPERALAHELAELYYTEIWSLLLRPFLSHDKMIDDENQMMKEFDPDSPIRGGENRDYLYNLMKEGRPHDMCKCDK